MRINRMEGGWAWMRWAERPDSVLYDIMTRLCHQMVLLLAVALGEMLLPGCEPQQRYWSGKAGIGPGNPGICR